VSIEGTILITVTSFFISFPSSVLMSLAISCHTVVLPGYKFIVAFPIETVLPGVAFSVETLIFFVSFEQEMSIVIMIILVKSFIKVPLSRYYY
jgi:hypothetical protein